MQSPRKQQAGCLDALASWGENSEFRLVFYDEPSKFSLTAIVRCASISHLLMKLAYTASIFLILVFAQGFASGPRTKFRSKRERIHRGQRKRQALYALRLQRPQRAKPIFYPVVGPLGQTLTRKYPLEEAAEGEAEDHPHHTSLWYTHEEVNGVDFWAVGKGKGKIVHQDFLSMEDSSFTALNLWQNAEERLFCKISASCLFMPQTSKTGPLRRHYPEGGRGWRYLWRYEGRQHGNPHGTPAQAQRTSCQRQRPQ